MCIRDSVYINPFSSRLEELLWVVVFFNFCTIFWISKLFRVVIQLLHPAPGVTAVRVECNCCIVLRIHLIDYILQGNHAVFEHPIPGVFFSMAAVVQVHVLLIICINPGSLGSFFDLRQDRLPLDDGVWVWKEDTMEMVGEMSRMFMFSTWSLVQDLLHDVHVNKSTR